MCFRSASNTKETPQASRPSKKSFDTYLRDYQAETGAKIPAKGQGTGPSGNNPYTNPSCKLGAAAASGPGGGSGGAGAC